MRFIILDGVDGSETIAIRKISCRRTIVVGRAVPWRYTITLGGLTS